MSERKLTLKTADGCRRLFVLFMVLVLVFGFFGRLVQSNFGSVKVEKITIDKHGGALDGELYYPAGTSDAHSLPAVVTTHGAFCTYGISKMFAEELARRGFVVFNISSYGYGHSEKSDWDAEDPDISSKGLNDAMNFLRSLTFVDKTRLGMMGHSMGALYTNYGAVADCGYYTLNDLKLNILYDEFGIEISKEQLYEDADSIAAAALNEDQLKTYNYLAQDCTDHYNTRIKTVVCLGVGVVSGISQSVVSVAGHDVSRSLQVNFASMFADLDHIMNAWQFREMEETQLAYYTPGESLLDSTWYILDDETATSELSGKLFETNAIENTALAEAADAKNLRINVTFDNQTHSKEFFSTRCSSAVTEVFVQTLGYNNGELGAASANPIDTENNIWQYRAIFNFLSMLSMIAMLIALSTWLTKSTVFNMGVAPIVLQQSAVSEGKSKKYFVMNLITVFAGFWIMYFAVMFRTKFFSNGLFRLYTSAGNLIYYLLGSGILGLGLLAYNKKCGNVDLKALGLSIGFKNVIKAFGIITIVGGAGYISLMVVDYLFGQDYRLWMTIFTYMRAERWIFMLPYAVIVLPLYLLCGIGLNHSLRTDISQRKDTFITVVVNSAGVWILCLVNFLIALNGFNGEFFAQFAISYQYVLLVPITVYITRKLYLVTGSIWNGALLNTFLVLWCHASETGLYYGAQTWLSNFLN